VDAILAEVAQLQVADLLPTTARDRLVQPDVAASVPCCRAESGKTLDGARTPREASIRLWLRLPGPSAVSLLVVGGLATAVAAVHLPQPSARAMTEAPDESRANQTAAADRSQCPRDWSLKNWQI
jgi:hypothetical protein